MCKNQLSRAVVREERRKNRTVRVGQMAVRPGDALLERIGVRPGLEHMRIVIALEHDGLAAAQQRRRRLRHKAEVGSEAETMPAVFQYVAHAVRRIMRRSERADRGLPHAEGVAALECSQPSLERRLLRGQRRRRAARGENRHLGLFEEHRKSLYMVDVLVRDDERVELARLHVERRERRCELAERNADVDQHRRAVRDVQTAVSARSARDAVIKMLCHGTPSVISGYCARNPCASAGWA